MHRTTYEFELPQKVKILIDLPIENIPIELMEYISAEAKYQFYIAYGGDADLVQFYYNDVAAKQATAVSADLRDRKDNGAVFTNVRIRYGEV